MGSQIFENALGKVPMHSKRFASKSFEIIEHIQHLLKKIN